MSFDSKPMILGRFNYTTYAHNLYNVCFSPYRGEITIYVAKNLDYETAISLTKELNELLVAAKDMSAQ